MPGMEIDRPAGAVDIAFIYEDLKGSVYLENLLKCGLLFFDRLAIKAELGRIDEIGAYVLEPLLDKHLLEIIDPADIMTREALERQNEIILDLLNAGAFDYLGPNPYWNHHVKLSLSPIAFLTYGVDEHRAFLAPVAEELMRRKLAVPFGKKAPAEIRRRFLNDRRVPIYYEGPLARKIPTRTAMRAAAFPSFFVYTGRDLIEFDGESFLQLAVHPDVAFLHEEIVRTIAYCRSTAQVRYHAFTNFENSRRVKRLLHLFPGSAYSEIVMTDLEQVAIDLRAVPLDELLGFRDEHRDRLIDYRMGLSAAISELSLCADADGRNAILLRRQEDLAVLAGQLKRACRKAFGVQIGSVAVGAVGMAWALGHGDPVMAVLSTASAILGVAAAPETYSHVRYLYDIQGAFPFAE